MGCNVFPLRFKIGQLIIILLQEMCFFIHNMAVDHKRNRSKNDSCCRSVKSCITNHGHIESNNGSRRGCNKAYADPEPDSVFSVFSALRFFYRMIDIRSLMQDSFKALGHFLKVLPLVFALFRIGIFRLIFQLFNFRLSLLPKIQLVFPDAYTLC